MVGACLRCVSSKLDQTHPSQTATLCHVNTHLGVKISSCYLNGEKPPWIYHSLPNSLQNPDATQPIVKLITFKK